MELYLGIHQERLRFFSPEGTLVPTPEEAAEAEFQRAEAEFQRAETERQQAEAEHQTNAKLIAKLRELGVDPDSL